LVTAAPPGSDQSDTRTVAMATCDSSACCCERVLSRSASRRVSSDSRLTTWLMSVASERKARNRATLISMACTRPATSAT